MPAGMLRHWSQWPSTKIAPTRRAKKRFRKRKISKAIKLYNVPKNKQVHYHIRRITTGTESNFSINTSGGEGEFLRAASFNLSQLQSYGELYNIYDQYKITKVVLDFQWTIKPTPLRS